MHRRTFCKTTIGAVAATMLPAIGRNTPGATAPIQALTSNGDAVEISAAAIDKLASGLKGRLLLPADPGYDKAHKIWNGMFDGRHPAMLVQCTHAEDVVRAVAFASERSLLLAVKGGGHSFPGKSTCDGGMMIDLSQMHRVDVDPKAHTAHVQGGALLGHLDDAALKHDLLTTTGEVSHTGVGGYTLGGGMGRTDRLMGMSIDNLLQATVVTAGGNVVTANEDENPDLFWALRGGGGNFGIATQFIYRLHPFDPMPYGGVLEWDISRARELFRLYAEINDSLPDAANVEPYFNPTSDGDYVAGVECCYAGDHGAGEKAFSPFLKLGDPLTGTLGPISYRSMQTQSDGIMAHGRRYYLKSGLLLELTEAAINAMIDNYPPDAKFGTWFEHMGGATSRIAADATAYAHRNAKFNFGISAGWVDPADDDAYFTAVRKYYHAIQPFMKGFYTNLNDDTEQKTWGNFGPAYPRLVKVKNKYDPTNLFRLNANVKPTV